MTNEEIIKRASAIFNENIIEPDMIKRQAQNAQEIQAPTPEVKPVLTAQGMAEQAQAVQAVNATAVTAQTQDKKPDNDKFAKLDKLRHRFNTHKEITKTEYIGGLFARGGVNVIAGSSGVGKTTLIQKFLHDLSIGGSILNGFYTEDRPRKSIIIAGELGEDGLIERAQLFDWHSDADYLEVIDFFTHEQNGISYDLNSKEGLANIEHLAKTPGLDLLVLDSFGMFYSGKENENDTLRKVFQDLMRIARLCNIAVVVVHHSRKRLSTEQQKPLTLDDLIGGNAIVRYCHRIIAVEYSNEIKANVVSCLKSWGQKFEKFSYAQKPGFYDGTPYLEFDFEVPDFEELKAQKTKSNSAVTSNAEITKGTIKAILKARGNKPITTKELREILEIPKDEKTRNDALRQYINRAIKSGEIKSAGHGLYALPETDRESDYETRNYDLGLADGGNGDSEK